MSSRIADDGTPIFDHSRFTSEPWYTRLAAALDETAKAQEIAFPEFMALVETVARALPFADGGLCLSCAADLANYAPGRGDALSYATRIKPDGGGWKAHYRCRNCGTEYPCWYAAGWATFVGMLEP